jgi:hypothetical protein
LGVRCTAASIGSAQTQRGAAPAFSPHRSAVLGVHVVVVAGLARRTESHSTRNRPALAPSRYRFDLEISITPSLARWTPADRPRDPPTDPRDGSRELSLGCTTHSRRAVKLGITVSQATVSRYMPTSRKDRRSQAWRTFIRNHAITIVQSHSFNGHNWARDLLSQVRSRLRAFTYHLSAFVVAPVTGPPCWAVWYTVHPLLVAVARPRVPFTRIVTLTTKSTALARRHPPADRKADLLTINRIRDPPAAQELKRHADRSSMRSTGKRLLHSTRPRQIARFSPTAIAAYRLPTPYQPLHPIFGTTFSMPPGMRGARFEEPQRVHAPALAPSKPMKSRRLIRSPRRRGRAARVTQ